MSNWQIGETVQAGFMTVAVKAVLLDSVYIVANLAETQLYKFIPHNGIHKITIEQAKNMMEIDRNRQATILVNIAAIQTQRGAVNAIFA